MLSSMLSQEIKRITVKFKDRQNDCLYFVVLKQKNINQALI